MILAFQATTATSATPQAPAAVQPPATKIPALPPSAGAPTGAPQPEVTTVVIRDGQPVIAGQEGTGVTSAGRGQPEIDPEAMLRAAMEGAIPLLGIVMSMVAIVFIGFPLVRAFARRMDKRIEIGMIKASDVMPQIRQLQESVDAMAVELERISEAQRFQAKLMADRGPVMPKVEGPRA